MSRHRSRQASRPTNTGHRSSQRPQQCHKSHRKQPHRLVTPTVAFTVALTGATALAQDTEILTAPPVEVREQRPSYLVPNLGLSKFPEPIQDIPQTINVVPEQLMQEQGVSTLQDALRNVTGISIQAGEGGGAQGNNLSIRGFNARNDIFLDGIRDQGSYFRDVFNLEAIEVLKGPTALYFGRGTTGGSSTRSRSYPVWIASTAGRSALGTDFSPGERATSTNGSTT